MILDFFAADVTNRKERKMAKMKVFVTREILPEGLEILRKNFDVDVWTEYAPPSKEIIKERVKDADAILTMLSDKIDAEIINSAPKLKIIAQLAVGYDNIDLKAAKARGIYVTNTPDALTDASADFSFALMMAISRRVVEADKYVRAGNWKVAWHPSMMLGAPLRGTTLGIIGAGRIGQAPRYAILRKQRQLYQLFLEDWRLQSRG